MSNDSTYSSKISKRIFRYAAAIILAPPLGCTIAYWIFVLGQIALTNDGSLSNLTDSNGIVTVAILMLAYPTMLCAGIPFMVFSKKYNLIKFWHYAVAGICAAWICALITFYNVPRSIFDFITLTVFTLGGFFCSAVFWAFLFLPVKKTAIKPHSSNS